MKVDVLASGSDGNCYALYESDGLTLGKVILLDCGISFGKTLDLINYKFPAAVLVTHEHGDHSFAAKKFLGRGVEVYMTAGTARALNLERHNLNLIKVGDKFTVEGFTITVLPSNHDANEPVNFIVEDADDRLLYVTDTREVPYVTGKFTKILIEANHRRRDVMLNPELPESVKLRILNSHLNIDQTVEFLKANPAEEIWLIHVSKDNGNVQAFAREVSERTNAPAVNVPI